MRTPVINVTFGKPCAYVCMMIHWILNTYVHTPWHISLLAKLCALFLYHFNGGYIRLRSIRKANFRQCKMHSSWSNVARDKLSPVRYGRQKLGFLPLHPLKNLSLVLASWMSFVQERTQKNSQTEHFVLCVVLYNLHRQ